MREIAAASKMSHATNVISGVAVGFETTAMTAVTISIALGAAYWLGTQSTVLPASVDVQKGIYGTAIATMGEDAEAPRVVGRVTSGAWSPPRRRIVALGYVQRDAAEPGRQLRVGDASATIDGFAS